MRALVVVIAALTVLGSGAPARAATTPRAEDDRYTLVAGDEDPATLVAHMGVDVPDAFREILFWNPQLHNVYALRPGVVLRRPGAGARPAFPAFDTDFSRWRVIASWTTRFVGSPPERVRNIVAGANAINNFFDDWRHPFISPRDSLSLDWLLGDITSAKGYVWGHAILVVDGVARDIPALGGGICQLPSTLFPAAIFAGLDVTRRVNHSYYPYFWWSYPEGFGFDATVDPPDGADLVIRNLYDHPVRFFMRADLAAQTLTAEVYAPPELTPFTTQVQGPFLLRDEGLVPAATAGWVWWAATTVVTQRALVDDEWWIRSFWSAYLKDPYW